MEERILDFYKAPNISEYEDTHLLSLWENCAAIEEKLEAVKWRMSEYDRQILDNYIEMRNELEFQTVKTVLRWGKQNYK